MSIKQNASVIFEAIESEVNREHNRLKLIASENFVSPEVSELRIRRVKGYYGDFSILIRAYTYIRTMVPEGFRQVSESVVLQTNKLRKKLNHYFEALYSQISKHEFVLFGSKQKKMGDRTLDMEKHLIDFGYHPPTVYFPSNLEECMMIEPTETESKETTL